MLKYQLIILFICFIFIFRFIYTLFVYNMADDLIYEYIDYLIITEKYNVGIKYNEKIKIEFLIYMFSLWKWGIYSCFKNEYVEIIKQPIKDRYNKQIIKTNT